VEVLEVHQNEVWCVKFSHGGEFLASASKDTTVVVWGIKGGEFSVKFQLKGHTEPVSNLSWSPNDKYLLSCGIDTTVKLWGVEVGYD
jgi:WD40 repeat protein